MANWSNPTTTRSYSTQVLQDLDGKDIDAATMFLNAPSNQPTGAMRWNRTTDKFEEWDGASWVAQLLDVAGGGTGASNAANARTNLGLGTMATQNANAVAITGGTVPATLLTGTVATARLGSGTASISTFLRGDSTWGTATPIILEDVIDLEVYNTSVETTVFSGTVAAGIMSDNKRLRIQIAGRVNAQGGSRNFTVRVKFGGVTITTIAFTVLNLDRAFKLESFITNQNTTGEQRSLTTIHVGGSQSASGTTPATASEVYDCWNSLTTVDTTGANTLEVTVQNATAEALTGFHIYDGKVEMI